MKKKVILFLVVLILIITVMLFFLNTNQNKKETGKSKENQTEKIMLNGEVVNFKKYRVNQQFYLEIPELFVEMSDEEVNKRYTNDFKPGLIFTNDKMDVELLVHATNDKVSNEEVSSFLESYKNTLSHVEIKDEKVTTIQQHNIASLNYIEQKDTKEESHHVLLFSLNEKALMIDFKYFSDLSDSWDKICTHTLNSLQFA